MMHPFALVSVGDAPRELECFISHFGHIHCFKVVLVVSLYFLVSDG